ncbi:opticin [Latimeria chalumnae]|uniref:opticin n=1 Tax=Latimeria chalumnae TaxID=7897 RepID=UPI0003C131D0|nr:PREDICTED: opticin [Latimeria chalumnae]|eukprot:XP_006002321.1 PREDICTED: opticin [Latimeria chalumnae]
MKSLLYLFLVLLTPEAASAAPATEDRKEVANLELDTLTEDSFDLDNYELNLDNYVDTIDLSNYGDLYDYGDGEPKIEVGTLPPLNPAANQNRRPLPEQEEEVPLKPLVTTPAAPKTDAHKPDIFGPLTELGLPTCLLCVCISSSVYCDDADLEYIPPLPKDTVYLYARFNKITRITATDFTGLKKLKRIDLTSNYISQIDDDALGSLTALQELILPENKLTSLPELPDSLIFIDARMNNLRSSGVRPEIFQNMKNLHSLYLSNNKLNYIPVPLPENLRSLHLQGNNIQTMHEETFCNKRDADYIRKPLEDIRLDGNPINLSRFSSAYFCLPRLPTGRLQ